MICLKFKSEKLKLNSNRLFENLVIKDFFDSLMWLFISPIDSRIRLYFPTHKLAIEVDEKGHTDRDKKKKRKWRREKNIRRTWL